MFLLLMAKGSLLDLTSLRGSEGIIGSFMQFSFSSGGIEGVLGVLTGFVGGAVSFSLD